MVGVPKYRHLLEDQDVRRWHDNLEAGSPITAEVYLRGHGGHLRRNMESMGARTEAILICLRVEKPG